MNGLLASPSFVALDGPAWLMLGSLALAWIGLLGLVLRRSLVGLIVGLAFAWASVAGLAIAAAVSSADESAAVSAGGLALSAAIVGCLEIAVGLALVVARVSRRGTIDVEEARLLEG
jgi:NADH:ubiquinone oxidoreductase subunit K